MSERRVVVTGLGATTPLGGTIAETWDGILAGRSGAKPLPEEWLESTSCPCTSRAPIAQKPEEVLTKVEVRRMDPSAQYAVIASRAAMEDAGSPEIDPLRLGVAIGTGIGGVLDPARPVGHPQGEGRSSRLPAGRSDADAEHARPRNVVAAARRPRRRAHRRVGLRLRRRVDGHGATT